MASEVKITVTTNTSNMPRAEVDDAMISAWIEDRLNDARNVFIKGMSGGGGGRQYGNHRASAPGEYPATDSGRLANSADYQMEGPRQGQLSSDLNYAAFLTDGTSHMAPRKMFVEALNEAMEARPMEDELAQAVHIVGGTYYGR